MSQNPESEPRFLVDRMFGTLCRYLRLMGYDTLSANSLVPGNRKEDTELVRISESEGRYLLTRDRELAVRCGNRGVFVPDTDVRGQVRQLIGVGLVQPVLRPIRCTICNQLLRIANEKEIAECPYAPKERENTIFSWCDNCQRLYWQGSHIRNLGERLQNENCKKNF